MNTELQEEVLDDIQDEVQEDPHEEVNETEEKARKMGWVPENEFKGDPNNWRPADEFVERGENMIPIIRANAQKAEERALAAEKKAEAALKHMKMVQERLHKKEQAQLEAKRREAVESGDVEAYDRISKEAQEIEPEENEDAIFADWKAENKWYTDDYEKYAEAEKYGQFLISKKLDLPPREFLDRIATHVNEKFQNPNRSRPSAVDGATPKPRKKSGPSINDITDPEERRQVQIAMRDYVKDGLGTEAEYLADYFA